MQRRHAAALTLLKRNALIMLLSASLIGCPPSNLKPSIVVTNSPRTLTISGQGFANVSPCANLALEGAPQPSSNLKIGQPQCAAGSFQNFVWQYSRDGDNCPSGNFTATVFAVDIQGSNASAAQTVALDSLPENCANVCCTLDQKCADQFRGVCCGLDAGPLCGHTGDTLGGSRCCGPLDTCTPDACRSSEVVCGVACLVAGSACCDDSFPPKTCGPGQSCCGDGCCPPGTTCRIVAGAAVCSPI